MKYLMVGICLFLVGCGSQAFASTSIAANDSNLTYIGRWTDTTVSSTPIRVAISGGNRLRFQFTGTSVGVTFDTTPSYDERANGTGYSTIYYPEYEYRIDGGSWTRNSVKTDVVSGSTDNPISVSGLSTGTHTFEMWVAGVNITTDKWSSLAGLRVAGITIDNGASVSSWPTGLPRLLVIGDSIGEGMLTLGSSPNAPPNFSGRQSFAAQLADLLGMELWDVSFGGSGFQASASAGNIPSTESNYLYKSNGVSQADPSMAIVLIESCNNNGSSNIQSRYATLLSEIQTAQPSAKVFGMGLIYPSPADQSYVSAAISAFGNGSAYISPVGWSYSRPNLSHPDVSGSASIAAYLQPILAPYVPVPVKVAADVKASFR